METQTAEYLDIIENETYKYRRMYVELVNKMINRKYEFIKIPVDKFKELLQSKKEDLTIKKSDLQEVLMTHEQQLLQIDLQKKELRARLDSLANKESKI